MLSPLPYLRWLLNRRLRDDGLNLPYPVLNLNDIVWEISQADTWANEGRFIPRTLHYMSTPFNLDHEAELVKHYYEAMQK